MRHQSLPQTKTPEELGFWIKQNALEQRQHTEDVPLTDEEIQSHEHALSVAAGAIIELKKLKTEFERVLKEGTAPNPAGALQPQQFTIPPTKGTKALDANVTFHDAMLKAGYKVVSTDIYKLPWPEAKKMIFVDIEGNEFESYRKAMTSEEVAHYTTLFNREDLP